jgi:hypothetical protein
VKFVRPVQVTDATLVSSTIPEDDHPAWNSGTTYAAGAKVILASTHRRYESVAGGNLNNNPATATTAWIDLGPTNRWAMFDATVGTITKPASGTTMTVVLLPGAIDSLALLDVVGSSVYVSMTKSDGVTVVYERTIDLTDTTNVSDWYSWFFERALRSTTVVLNDIPPYGAGKLTVTITNTVIPSCGTFVVGRYFHIGDTQWNPKAGIIDYSSKSTDEFGVTSVVQRSYARRQDCVVRCSTPRVNEIVRQLAAVRATPVIWLGADALTTVTDTLAMYGFIKDFSVDIAYPEYSMLSMTIEGLV